MIPPGPVNDPPGPVITAPTVKSLLTVDYAVDLQKINNTVNVHLVISVIVNN